MKERSLVSQRSEDDVTISQSDMTNSSPQQSNTQASQMNEIEDLSTIGGLPSMKDLSQEEYASIYNRYARSFKSGRYNTSLVISSSKDDVNFRTNNFYLFLYNKSFSIYM